MTPTGLLARMRGAAPAGDVLWLGDPAADDPARVGGKAANLSRLTVRWPVPPGFCLPVELDRRLGGVGRRRAARRLRRLVAPAYRMLAERTGRRRPRVAVRSSAADEDTAAASFAGQHDTVLNAVGVRAVCDAVADCWASGASARADAYRDTHGLDDAAAMGVLVQHLVDADVSAVVFSADPVTGDRGQVLINAAWGLGEAVVAGTVTPDTYRVSRDRCEVVARDVADKDVMVVSGRRGTRAVPVPPHRRTHPTLDADRCRELAGLAAELKRRMGWPVDLECAYADGQLFLLQCRPITSLPTS